MMKIAVFGATGGIGKHVVRHALEKGYDVVAVVRNKQKMTIRHEHLTVVEASISDYSQVKAAISGCAAVVWCVGIPIKRKYEHMASLEGHQILLKAMKACGIRRLVDWSTPSVHFEHDKKSVLTVMPGIMAGLMLTQAKREMVAIGNLLQASDTDWTLVRFLAPKDTPFTGKVKVSFGDVRMRWNISREDIASFMVEQIDSPKYIHSMPIIGS